MKQNGHITSINIRLDKKARLRLASLAKKYGITASDLVRFAINEKLPLWESQGISLSKTTGELSQDAV